MEFNENVNESTESMMEFKEETRYHPGIEPGVDFIYGSDQEQYMEKKEEE